MYTMLPDPFSSRIGVWGIAVTQSRTRRGRGEGGGGRGEGEGVCNPYIPTPKIGPRAKHLGTKVTRDPFVNIKIEQLLLFVRGGCARVIAKICGMQFKLSRSISNVLFLLTQRVELG